MSSFQTFQISLLATVVALTVAHFLRPSPSSSSSSVEPFLDAGTPIEVTPDVGPATDHPSMSPDVEDDVRDLPWIASWNAADKYARRGKDCVPTYTEDGPDGTTILTTAKSCEDGLPHTRVGDRIVIPDSNLPTDRALIIRHEMIHIYQRRSPQKWVDFYRRNWSFVLYKEPPKEIPADLIAARRSNPDTWDPAMGGSWACWQGRWWPICVYRNRKTPQIRDAVIVWWDAWKQTSCTVPPESWVSFFGHVAQPEHPHEIAAVILTSEDNMSEAGRRLLQWWSGQPESIRLGGILCDIPSTADTTTTATDINSQSVETPNLSVPPDILQATIGGPRKWY